MLLHTIYLLGPLFIEKFLFEVKLCFIFSIEARAKHLNKKNHQSNQNILCKIIVCTVQSAYTERFGAAKTVPYI